MKRSRSHRSPSRYGDSVMWGTISAVIFALAIGFAFDWAPDGNASGPNDPARWTRLGE